MPLYSRYDPTKSGDVNAQAHPNVYVYPFITTQRAVRSNPTPASAYGNTGGRVLNTTDRSYGTRIQRIQPNEKKAWFSLRGFSMAAMSPARSKCGCGGSAPGATEGTKKNGAM